jgi:hypothetical protein
MAKKKAAPKPPGASEGKAPLVIALAFFVIATIAAGVMAYTFEGENAAERAKTEEAKTITKSLEKSLAEVEERLRLYQVAIGTGTADDVEKLKSPQNDTILRDDHAKIVAAINSKITAAVKAEAATLADGKGQPFEIKPEALYSWPWPAGGQLAGGPKESMPERMVKLVSERERGLRLLSESKQLYDAAAKVAAEEKKAYEADKANFAAKLAEKDADVKKHKDANDKKLAQSVQDYNTAANQYTASRKDAFNQVAPLQKDLELTKNELAQAREELKSIKASTNPQKLIQFDNPTGSITASFTKQKIVEIDLGSADKVRAGLTFTVYPREAKDRGSDKKTPKALIEVVEVVASNLSRARVTHYEDEIRNPITKGDLLYNIAWQKGRVDHVVLFGIFDIDGDGSDDIKVVARDLAKMGVIVDGYFDLSTRKWVGAAPSYRTDYAVVGNLPTINPGDSLAPAKGDLVTAINTAELAAREKGVNVIRSREFFTGIGYKIKFDVSDETVNQAATKFLKTPEPPPAAN